MAFRTDGILIDSESATVGGYRLLNNQPATNADTATIFPGMPLVVVGDNLVKRASAASFGLANVDGIAFSISPVATPVIFRSQGRITLTPSDWDLITGESGGLFPGAIYYLALGAGMLTSSAPFLPGQAVVHIGKAFSPGSLIIEIAPPLLL